ncbi:hypothetical protein LIER_11819 [Lithospermum erythrorhizon]|uniref:Reverse transcriptase n=1 Tax=Lithospermum erythrorhizon TaxID=34254 RepID=A0AAV3PPI9_LITER
MFADDIFLLGKASTQKAHTIKRILNLYEEWSGQLVSVQKSSTLFSPNVAEHTRRAILGILGMLEVPTHGKYQGLPTNIGAFKKEVFNSVIDRIYTKVADWKTRLLSKVDKKVFLTSVLQSIPTYTMQCFKLPIHVRNNIDSILSN